MTLLFYRHLLHPVPSALQGLEDGIDFHIGQFLGIFRLILEPQELQVLLLIVLGPVLAVLGTPADS
jgi:hypothetical protein